MYSAWAACISFSEHYQDNEHANFFLFGNSGSAPFTDSQQQAWDTIQENRSKFLNALDKILLHVRNNYLEIDIRETNKLAWQKIQGQGE